MSDDVTPETPETPSADLPAGSKWDRWKRILRRTAVVAVVVPILLLSFWVWVTLSWSYSDGERAGTLQKFSRKGWICKTWEGELQVSTIPGSAPILWDFSVRDDHTASLLEEAVSHNGRVVLTYEEHRGVPTDCFGETPYFVTGVRLVK